MTESNNLPTQVPLPESRPLSDEERALLDVLLAGPLGRPELTTQARTAVVVSECSCGCPSVGLASKDNVSRLVIDASESPTHDPEVYTLTAHGDNEDGVSVQVTLHVISGRLNELEIWGGEYGPIKLPAPTALTYAQAY